MSDQFKWSGNVLRGPFKLLVGHKFDLPRGPPESSPFNTGQWSLQFQPRGEGWVLAKTWTQEATRAGDATLDWRVTNGVNSSSPRAIILHADNIGPRLVDTQSCTCANADSKAWNVQEHIAADSKFELTVNCPSLSHQASRPDPCVTASYIKGMMTASTPHDVLFVFDGTDDQLWASSILLKQESPFFNNLFASVGQPAQQSQSSTPSSTSTISLFDDQPTIKLEPPSPNGRPAGDPTYTVKVTGASPHVFQAILLWLSTKYDLFKPDSDTTADETFNAHSLPLILWRQAYKFANLLGLGALRKLALEKLAACLSVENAAGELFDGLSVHHLDVREVVMKFAVENWGAVKASVGMQEKSKLVDEELVEGGGKIAMELAMRL